MNTGSLREMTCAIPEGALSDTENTYSLHTILKHTKANQGVAFQLVKNDSYLTIIPKEPQFGCYRSLSAAFLEYNCSDAELSIESIEVNRVFECEINTEDFKHIWWGNTDDDLGYLYMMNVEEIVWALEVLQYVQESLHQDGFDFSELINKFGVTKIELKS